MENSLNISKQQCMEWSKNPSINPLTKRKITQNGNVYNQIRSACESKYGIRPGHVGPKPSIDIPPVAASSKPNIRNNMSSKVQSKNNPTEKRLLHKEATSRNGAQVRYCPHLIDIKPPSVPLTNHRKSTQVLPEDQEELHKIRVVYERLKLCDAPPNVSIAYTTDMQMMMSLFSVMMSHMNFMYGDTVLPCMLQVKMDNKGHTDASVISLPVERAPSTTYAIHDFKDIMRHAFQGSGPTCILTGSEDEDSNHALALFIFHNYEKQAVHLHVIDPGMSGNQTTYYEAIVIKYLESEMSKYMTKGSYIISSSVPDILAKTMQGQDRIVPLSSLDTKGYCLIWSMMMIEVIAIYLNMGNTIHSLNELFTGIGLMTFMPMNRPTVWRKLVIDYAYSRLLMAFSATVLFKGQPHWLFDNFVKPYAANADTISIQRDIAGLIGQRKYDMYSQIAHSFIEIVKPWPSH